MPTLFNKPSFVFCKFVKDGARNDGYYVIRPYQLLEGADKRPASWVFGQIQPDARIDEHLNRTASAQPLAHGILAQADARPSSSVLMPVGQTASIRINRSSEIVLSEVISRFAYVSAREDPLGR
jgi:hypothetical protein